MGIRTGAVALVAVCIVSACTDSSDNGADPQCLKLVAASDRVSDAQQKLYSGGDEGRAALTRVVGELRDLQKDAPADISSSLSKLATAFEQAQAALALKNEQGAKQLAQAADVLSAEGMKVRDYVASNCT